MAACAALRHSWCPQPRVTERLGLLGTSKIIQFHPPAMDRDASLLIRLPRPHHTRSRCANGRAVRWGSWHPLNDSSHFT